MKRLIVILLLLLSCSTKMNYKVVSTEIEGYYDWNNYFNEWNNYLLDIGYVNTDIIDTHNISMYNIMKYSTKIFNISKVYVLYQKYFEKKFIIKEVIIKYHIKQLGRDTYNGFILYLHIN